MSRQRPATYGGAGWRPRQRTHREDVQAGALWHRCGSSSEVEDLREVMLAWPDGTVFRSGDPDDVLFLEWPDVQRLQAQASVIGSFYESQGIKVHWARPPGAPPNFLFQRDLFFMTPDGAVLARPGAAQRAAEARLAAAALAGVGVPIIGTPHGDALFEGADALWMDRGTVLIGLGRRTNQVGARFVAGILRDIGVDAIQVAIPDGVQHLLGVVNFADRKLAAIRADKATDELRGVLRAAGIETVSCGPGPEVAGGFGMNFVTLGPRRVVMPAHCPSVSQSLARAGVATHEIEISEYLKAAGGLGCLTGILHRNASVADPSG